MKKYNYWFYQGDDANELCHGIYLMLLDNPDPDPKIELLTGMTRWLEVHRLLSRWKEKCADVKKLTEGVFKELHQKLLKNGAVVVNPNYVLPLIEEGAQVYPNTRFGFETMVKDNGPSGTADKIMLMMGREDVQDGDLLVFEKDGSLSTYCIFNTSISMLIASLLTSFIANKIREAGKLLENYKKQTK